MENFNFLLKESSGSATNVTSSRNGVVRYPGPLIKFFLNNILVVRVNYKHKYKIFGSMVNFLKECQKP